MLGFDNISWINEWIHLKFHKNVNKRQVNALHASERVSYLETMLEFTVEVKELTTKDEDQSDADIFFLWPHFSAKS